MKLVIKGKAHEETNNCKKTIFHFNESLVTFKHICTIKQTWQIPVMAVSYSRWRIAIFNNNLHVNPLRINVY